MKEEKLQQELFLWFYNSYPKMRGLFFHNYNNPPNAIAGARLVGMGLVKGLPDMTVAIKTESYGALYLELKKKGEKPRQSQLEIFNILRAAGNRVEWTDNLEEAKEIILDYLSNSVFFKQTNELF